MIANHHSISRWVDILSLLLDRNFRGLWSAGLLQWTIFGIETLATSIYIFSVTESPLLVTSLLAARMAPMIILGSIVGALAERLPGIILLSLGYLTLAVVFLYWAQSIFWGRLNFGTFFLAHFSTELV